VTKYATVAGESGIRGPIGAWSRSSETRYLLNYLLTKSSPRQTKQAFYCLDVAEAQLFMINRVGISAPVSCQRQHFPSDGWCSLISPWVSYHTIGSFGSGHAANEVTGGRGAENLAGQPWRLPTISYM